MATSLWVAVTTIKKDFPGLRATKSLWFFRYPLSNALTVSPDQLTDKFFIASRWELSGLCSPQVSVLTDQVEAQGEKIRDLDLCLDEHREKLNATEDMLQQVCWSWQVESFSPCVAHNLGWSCLLATMHKKSKYYYYNTSLFNSILTGCFLSVGTSLQSVAGDTEAWADVWSVQSQAEAKRFGQGPNGLWQI